MAINMCPPLCHVSHHEGFLRRVHFHTQLADKANKSNSDDVKQLLQAVYDIMAPEGKHCTPVM